MSNDARGEAEPPTFGLVIVGDEILSGKRADKHFAHVVGALGERGLRLAWAQYQPDDRARLVAALTRSFAGRDHVFVCGGIGSTPDDHTRQAAAEALGLGIERHVEAVALIAQRCRQLASEGRGSADMNTTENQQRLKMAEFPTGSAIIPNPYNGIAGFTIQRHWFVPGFPVMAWPMIDWVLDNHYAAWFYRTPLSERSLVVFETAESLVAPLMEDVEREFPGVKAFSLPSVGDGSDGRLARRHIELGVKGPPEIIEVAYRALQAGVVRLGSEWMEAGQQAEKKPGQKTGL